MSKMAMMKINSVEESLPPSGHKVLAFYRNRNGIGRMICAEFVAARTLAVTEVDDIDGDYDEESDTYYWTEGWYERIDNLDEHSHIAIYQGVVTHWANLSETLNIFRELTGGEP